MNCHHFDSVWQAGWQPLVFVIVQKVAVNVKYIHDDDDDDDDGDAQNGIDAVCDFHKILNRKMLINLLWRSQRRQKW